ncbi:LCP family protein [Salinactinospora qingdaonensis]|uniref:Cell envelope-related transcriptional attenuator domain-containing protein n=1 Tax=Salinactinospora qingdaonensis TaxID=702744 RepID=A0ABP7FH97_9ACTN
MGARRALLWTAVSAVIPGCAHLRTGRRWSGGIILACYIVLLAAAGIGAAMVSGDVVSGARIVVQGQWLLTAAGVAFAVAVLWMTVIIHSWVITKPPRNGWGTRLTAGFIVAVLCVAVASPAALVMRSSYTAYDTLSTVFGPEPDAPHDASDPWDGAERITMLLLGGDSGDNRYGLRTDSMIAASIDVDTGEVVLVSLPRNLENVPFPPGTELALRYPEPRGFDRLLNEVYQTVAENPAELAIDPTVENPAADTLKRVIGNAIGLDLDYYGLVDLQGFEDLIDALGGIDVYIEEPIIYGEREEGILEAGYQHLDGDEALWYGRSRVNSDDYTRMGRQGCLIKYVTEQVDPTQVLTSFQELAGATKRTLQTDIPQSKVPHLLDLAEMATNADMQTLQLSPPQVNTANPDWQRISELVDEAVRDQEDTETGTNAAPSPAQPSGDASPSQPSPTQSQNEDDRTAWQRYTGSDEASPTSPGRQVGEEATSLDKLCP